jgi:transposase
MTKHALPQNWKEARRKRAFELQTQGWQQRAIARAFGVSDAAVSQWMAARRERGTEAWHDKRHPSGPIKLTSTQLGLLPELLSHGAEAYGFRGNVWTCARVAAVMWGEFGATYHKAHVSRLLKALSWTPQLPIERAAQRNEAAIEQWRVQVWPELKKRQMGKAAPLFLWMNRAFICCQGWSEHMRLARRHRSCGRCIPAITCRS